MQKHTVKDYISNPNWASVIFIPFIRSAVPVEVVDGNIHFAIHGMNYIISGHQEVGHNSDGSARVAISRKQQCRTLRKPIGLPSHTSIYFMNRNQQAISRTDTDTFKRWLATISPKVA